MAVAAIAAVARRRQNGRERTVFIKAVQKRDEDGQSAATKYV